MEFRRHAGRNSFREIPKGSQTKQFFSDSKESRSYMYRKIYLDKYPLFWQQFNDILDSEMSNRITTLRHPVPESNTSHQANPSDSLYSTTRINDPDEENEGFPIFIKNYAAIDFHRGFTLEDPLDLEDFVTLCDEIKEINAKTIKTDDPRDGFLFPTQELNNVPIVNTDIADTHDTPEEQPHNETRGGYRGRGGQRGRGRGGGSTNNRGRGRRMSATNTNTTGATQEEQLPTQPEDLANFMDQIFSQMESKFTDMAQQVLKRIDEMSSKINELESSIDTLMQQAEQDK